MFPLSDSIPSGMSSQKFSKFIYNALILVDDISKIKKFHIRSDCDKVVFLDSTPILNMDAEEVILEFHYCYNYNKLPELLFHNASLVKLRTYHCDFDSMTNVSVSFGHLRTLNIENCRLSSPKMIENILCGSPSLELLEISNNYVDSDYFIASGSLKRLVLNCWHHRVVEIFCPNLEELKLFGRFEAVYVLNYSLKSLIFATLDYDFDYDSYNEYGEIEIIQHLHNAKELNFGRRFIQALSDLREDGFTFPSWNNKSLTLDNLLFRKHHGGIVSALRSSDQLEKLIIKLPIYETTIGLRSITRRSYWTAKGRESKYRELVPHLKIVEVIGLSEQDDKYILVVNFIKFLLKNAMKLKKLVVIFKNSEEDFVTEVSKKLLKFPKCARGAQIRLECSNA